MFCFSLLVNACSINWFVKCLCLCETVFSAKYQNEEVRKAYTTLCALIQKIGTSDDEIHVDETTIETYDKTEENIELEEQSNSEEDYINLTAQKPFLPYLRQQIKKNLTVCTPENCSELNPFYQPQWIATMEKKWLPLTPFWTCMLRGEYCTQNHTCKICCHHLFIFGMHYR